MDKQQLWQLCPKCNGDGNLARYNSPSVIGTDAALLCDICNGAKVLASPSLASEKERAIGFAVWAHDNYWDYHGSGNWLHDVPGPNVYATSSELYDKYLKALKNY